jgi:hypothetical protein
MAVQGRNNQSRRASDQDLRGKNRAGKNLVEGATSSLWVLVVSEFVKLGFARRTGGRSCERPSFARIRCL